METVKRWALSGVYDLIVLDEFTYPLTFGYIDVEEVVSFITEHNMMRSFPPRDHRTGAPETLCDRRYGQRGR